MTKHSYTIRSEGDFEAFLVDLALLLVEGRPGLLCVDIPHARWIDIIFDAIEADEKYQCPLNVDPFLDLEFALPKNHMKQADDILMGELTEENLQEVLDAIADALEEDGYDINDTNITDILESFDEEDSEGDDND